MTTPVPQIVDPGSADGSMWTRDFWKGAGERAVKTFAQAALAVFGVGTVVEVTGSTLNADTWVLAGLSGLAAAVLSVLMSIANPGFVKGSPVRVTVDIPAVAGPGVAAYPGVEPPTGGGAHRAVSLADEVAAVRGEV